MQLIDRLAECEQLNRITDAMGGHRPPVAIFGVNGTAAAVVCAAINRRMGGKLLIITETDAAAASACSDLSILGIRAVHYPQRDFVFHEVESASHDNEQQRLFALGRAENGLADIVCASIDAAKQPTVPRSVLSESSIRINVNGKIDRDSLLLRLSTAGYVRAETVEGTGQYSVRGGIVDVFPCAANNPVRIDLFGDTVDALYGFDRITQRRTKKLSSLYITPAREVIASAHDISAALDSAPEKLREICERDLALIDSGSLPASFDRYISYCYPDRETLFDYMDGCPTVMLEGAAVAQHDKMSAARIADDLLALTQEGLISKRTSVYFSAECDYSARPLAATESFSRRTAFDVLSDTVHIESASVPRWGGDLKQLTDDIAHYRAEQISVAVLSGTPKAAAALVRDLIAAGYDAHVSETLSPDSGVSVCPFTLSGGFYMPDMNLCVISSRREPQHRRSTSYAKREGRGIGSLEELTPGDLVVHVNHGVGRFVCIQTVDFHGLVTDYIKIAYRGSDVLFVPVTQLDMVSLYTAPSEKALPPLAKLNSGEWQKTKQAVYRSARDMAKELIELYSKRSVEQGVSFSPDSEWQRDFETRFQYDETDDQLQSIREVKLDMERSAPMDRLLCGDVGVGKTEVAMRAAFKAVNDGYQVAVLVPTTILAWQHYHSFSQRFDNFPVSVAMMSRFSSAKQLKAGLKGVADGTVDIAIGTHRLLQNDVKFRKLGLVVIDEEQRFGVEHKEKLKQAFLGVDVLTLSATPIPRTLDMAMSGIRDISIIDEPPVGRQPVQTYVMEHDVGRVNDAIRQELSRGGQVYYLHNRVDSIERCAEKLREAFPDARILVGHGKMPEDALSRVWQQLIDGECDILVCTTIIETGVDVPNVNTLIVENADDMGLSQLYQLRGRVGRSARRAYAYFTFKRDSVLTEVAAKRLAAIRDFTGFGSGFRIAMRDLQIRGAGSVLTARQSGHMHAVGYDMYLKILNEAISDEKGLPRKKTVECVADLSIDAHIPQEYIESTKNRIEIYKKIAAVESEESASEMLEELRDRFGEPPNEAIDLIAVSQLRAAASALGIYEIRQNGNAVLFYSDDYNHDAVMRLLRKRLRETQYFAKGKSYLSITVNSGERVTEAVLGFLKNLAECVETDVGALQQQNNSL